MKTAELLIADWNLLQVAKDTIPKHTAKWHQKQGYEKLKGYITATRGEKDVINNKSTHMLNL